MAGGPLFSSRRGVTVVVFLSLGALLYVALPHASQRLPGGSDIGRWADFPYLTVDGVLSGKTGSGSDKGGGGGGAIGGTVLGGSSNLGAGVTGDDSNLPAWTWGAHEQVDPEDTSKDILAYRKHLEETTSPVHFKHSRTLTFSHIYVVSLPNRQERRERMNKIAKALGLEFTFVDAVDKNAGVVGWISQRVAEIRKKKQLIYSDALGVNPEEIGGGGPEGVWLQGTNNDNITLPDLDERRWGNKDWVSYLESTDPYSLEPIQGFNATEALYDPLEKYPGRQIHEATIATWYSHTKAMHEVDSNGDENALILEDDVDFEFDVERMWASMHRRLPKDWDTVFLGHCWGHESQKPAYLHPLLHQSSQPRCMHAYAVTHAGAEKIIDSLADPWLAYQGPVDNALPSLVYKGALNSFSAVPPLIIQAKDSPSDVQGGSGTQWRGVLADSTVERIWRDEGKEVKDPVFDPLIQDPAVHYGGRIPGGSLKKPTDGFHQQEDDPGQRPKIDFEAGQKPKEEGIIGEAEAVEDASTGTDPNDATRMAAAPAIGKVAGGFHPVIVPPRKKPPTFEEPKKTRPKVGTGGKVIKADPKKVVEDKGRTDQANGAGIKAGAVAAAEAGRRVGTGARPGAKGLAIPPGIPKPPPPPPDKIPNVGKGKGKAGQQIEKQNVKRMRESSRRR